MSFCRFSANCDLYMYKNRHGGVWCIACSINNGIDIVLPDKTTAIEHINHHIEKGDNVPGKLIKIIEDRNEEINSLYY